MSEYLQVEGFIEVVFLSFKTCHVREAILFSMAIFFCNFVGNISEKGKFLQNFSLFKNKNMSQNEFFKKIILKNC